ncbi:MAG: hypothetical protein OJF60_003066 [Burkholderiaceae bacterium]|jgi:hypothetical protein|nr:MAG: hypothetical protein OJF60_003066 [Burkholderiaceae bacterium]
METDLPTAALRSSQATHAAVDKSPSTSHTKIQTLPAGGVIAFRHKRRTVPVWFNLRFTD